MLQTNDLVSGLQQVADESRVTYLLGYEPTNDKRDGRYRKLHVEVTRPGLTVRARAGYFAEKGKKKPEPEPTAVDRALRNPFDADGIPLRLAAYVMGPAPLQSPVPKTGVEVLIAGRSGSTRCRRGLAGRPPRRRAEADAPRRARARARATVGVDARDRAGAFRRGRGARAGVAPVPDADRDGAGRPPGAARGRERREGRLGDGGLRRAGVRRGAALDADPLGPGWSSGRPGAG